MEDLIDGTLDGWPVSLMIERDLGNRAYGAQCAPYTDNDDNSASEDIMTKCQMITDACYDLTPAKAVKKAKSMGFVPDAA